jgi:hypothetical protein
MLELAPKNPCCLTTWLGPGQAQRQERRQRPAGLSLAPNSPVVLDTLGTCCSTAAIPKGVETLRKAVSLGPSCRSCA